MKRTVTVTLATAEKYDAGFPTDDAVGFAAWLSNLIEQVPPEHRHTAKLEISSVGSYEDTHYATVTFLYSRKETDEEEAERESKEAQTSAIQRNRELQQLAALKAKYESGV